MDWMNNATVIGDILKNKCFISHKCQLAQNQFML